MPNRNTPRALSLSPFRRACSLLLLEIGFVSFFCSFGSAASHEHWTELNIGPFYVDTDSDVSAAREALTQLEQVRWVLGGLLESKDLQAVWPIRVIFSNSARANAAGHFVWQNAQFLLLTTPNARVPLGDAAGILLDENTPRLPPEIESGIRQLFDTLEAHGSHVTWGGRPEHPDLAWARMQLFATKFEYSSSFHIFLNALKGSDVRAAEQNAFGKPSELLEQQAAAVLAAGTWQPVAVSGRPLDPKRDFGEHSLAPVIADLYIADAELTADPNSAEAAFKAAVEAKGPAAALGYAGLARIAELQHQNPKEFLDDAIHAGSLSAPVYADAADGLDAQEAVPLLKKAAQLNPRWAEPVFRQAAFAADSAQKLALLKQATQLDPRATRYWLELAKTETDAGDIPAANGAWLRAEDSAPTDAERNRIHQMRLDSEQERLDAAAQARRRERESVHLADEKAQQTELDRIRAAEAKANGTVDAQAGTAKPENAVPWDQLVVRKKLQGTLFKVECLRTAARLWVKDASGKSIELLMKDISQSGLGCGVQQPPRRVSLQYAADPDDRLHTAGNVVSLQVH